MSSYRQQLTSRKERPGPERLVTPANLVDFPKPDGGLWTSTPLEAGGVSSEWTEWAEHERRITVPNTWRLTVASDARIYELNSREQAQALIENYQTELPEDEFRLKLREWSGSGLIDWERFAADYDALHFTPYAGARDIKSPFAMWDVESTWWARWCFDDVELAVGERKVSYNPADHGYDM